MKKQYFFAISIIYLMLLLNACLNTNNNSEQQNLFNSKNQIDSSAIQETNTFTDSRDGKTYKTIKIGTQIWMAENLRYKADSGCWAYKNNENNANKYGYLYNWETAKKVCPAGWHLPSDDEWTILTNYLGSEEIAGGKLKATTGWKIHNERPDEVATNSSGFTALPGGIWYDGNGAFFQGIGGYGGWWSSTIGFGGYWYRYLKDEYNEVFRDIYPGQECLSIRCLKDN